MFFSCLCASCALVRGEVVVFVFLRTYAHEKLATKRNRASARSALCVCVCVCASARSVCADREPMVLLGKLELPAPQPNQLDLVWFTCSFNNASQIESQYLYLSGVHPVGRPAMLLLPLGGSGTPITNGNPSIGDMHCLLRIQADTQFRPNHT